MREWPTYLPNQVVKGNPDADTIIICCWEPRDDFAMRLKTLDPRCMDRIAGIGNLYTQERGIDFVLRNILANPKITRVLITGLDRSGAGEALLAFFRGEQVHDDGKYWRMRTYPKVKIRGDITSVAFNRLVNTVKAHRIEELDAAFLYDLEKGVGGTAPVYYDPPREKADHNPSYEHGHIIRGKTIPEVYLDMLHEIMTFGRVDTTHYDQRQRELLDLVCVITDQTPKPKELPPFIPFSLEDLAEYGTELMSPEKDESVTYQYGHRIRAYFGVDQFKSVAVKLLAERDCRSAVISLWDPAREGVGKIKGSPCLNHLWFRIRNAGGDVPALHMTATIRSNDMYTGWPENAFGLRILQERMRTYLLNLRGDFQDDKGLELGDLVVVSQSAHLYEDCWEPAREVIAAHRKFHMEFDQKGNWIFQKNREGEIEGTLMDPSGFDLVTLKARTANGLRMKIARRNLVADVSHAMYLGEKMKEAEMSRPGTVIQ